MNDRLYAVMTDSHRPFDKTVLARRNPRVGTNRYNCWTDRNGDDVWLLPREEAEDVRNNLVFNNPRIVRAEKALTLLDKQQVTK